MTLSPGYPYEKAPDQKHFLGTAETSGCSRILGHRKRLAVHQSRCFCNS